MASLKNTPLLFLQGLEGMSSQLEVSLNNRWVRASIEAGHSADRHAE